MGYESGHGPSDQKFREEVQGYVAGKLGKSYAESPKGLKKGPEWSARKGEKAAAKIDLTDPRTREKMRSIVDVGVDVNVRQALSRQNEAGVWTDYHGIEAGSKKEVGRAFKDLAKSQVDHLVSVTYLDSLAQPVPVTVAPPAGPAGPAGPAA